MRSIERITSRDNQRLKLARQVRDGREPRYIFIEGRRLAEEAVRSGLSIRECYLASGFNAAELLKGPSMRSAVVAELSTGLFGSIADTKRSQGIILIADRPKAASTALIESRLKSSKLPIVIFLHEINNPSNLGAVFRTAEAAGVAGIIISRNSADAYSPKSLRAAMGSAFRVPVWDNADLEQVISWAKTSGLTPTASNASSTTNHTDVDWLTPRLLIFGSEAHGLDGVAVREIDQTARISMEARVESLNLAVSAGILLFEARRQVDHRS